MAATHTQTQNGNKLYKHSGNPKSDNFLINVSMKEDKEVQAKN